MFLILQPIAIVLEIVGSIVDFLGFNGFMRVSEMYKAERAGAATLGLIVALLYLAMGLYSAFIYVKILRERKDLKVV
jgi:multisubunit Na+/H+ antiporter MnhG subunit